MTTERFAKGLSGYHSLKVSWLWCLPGLKMGSLNQKHVLKIGNIYWSCGIFTRGKFLNFTIHVQHFVLEELASYCMCCYKSTADAPWWVLTLRQSPWQPYLHSSHTVPFYCTPTHCQNCFYVYFWRTAVHLCSDRKLSHNLYSYYISHKLVFVYVWLFALMMTCG